jgi:hypothetical protein
MARTRKNTVSPTTISLDWTQIDADLKAGKRVSLSHLAQAHKVFPIDLRRIFESRYGDQIIFKRGRTGGVFWKSSTAIAAAAGTQSAPDEEIVALA